MAQVKMLMNAYKLKKAVVRLEKAKINSIRALNGLPPIRPWYETIYINTMTAIKQTLLQAFCPCVLHMRKRKDKTVCCFKADSFFGKLFTDGTYHNEIMKNIVGFIGGTILSFLMYLLMAMSLDLSMRTAAGMAMCMGIFFSIGLAFSERVRCVILLMLPNFFSSKGRSFILMYTMVLVMTHPVTNFSNNIMVMADSATCGQSMALNETKALIQAASSPIAAIIGGLEDMLRAISKFANTMRRAFQSMKNAIQEICAAISRIFKWLKGMTDKCNETMGSPYRKCKKAFEEAEQDCRDALGIIGGLCKIVEWVGYVCHVVRVGELLCIVVDVVVNFVAENIAMPINSAIKNVYDMFYFNVTLDYHYNLTMIQSKSYADVRQDIMDDIQSRMGNIGQIITMAETVMMFTFLLVYVRAMLYRWRYLTNDKFDNIFITETLKYIDEKRKEKGLETIFPLSLRESGKYLKPFTIRLAANERAKMLKGLIFLIFNALHASFYLLCDYSLYWILKLVQYHLEVKINPAVPAHLKLHVQGEGAMSDMYRAMIGLLDPVAADKINVDTTPCLPNPTVPNYRIYKLIGWLFLVCLIMSLFEAYALRMRHVVAGCYYPKRDQARAVWLYNKITKLRGKFLTVVRRQVRRKYQKDKAEQKVSIRARIAVQCPALGKVLKFFGYEKKACLSCGVEGNMNDYENFQHCESPGCDAVYCLECFTSMNNLCTVCMNPLDYGDGSDVSEERDSSDDEFYVFFMKERARERRERIAEIREENRTSKTILAFKGLAGISAKATNSEVMEMDLNAPLIQSSSSDSDLDYSYQDKKTKGGNSGKDDRESADKKGVKRVGSKAGKEVFDYSSDSDSSTD